LDVIFDYLRDSNKYIDDTTPWSLAKDDANKDRLETVLYNLLQAIHTCSILLQPFIPTTSERIFEQLGVTEKGLDDIGKIKEFRVGKPEVLFKRIEIDK
jgi:methionyl-tRNA synthetase